MQNITRRTALSAAGVSALALVLAACGSSDTGSSNSAADKLQAIKDAGKIRIGFEGTFAPWNYHNEAGELVGMEKEIGDLIAADLGVTAEYTETPWDSLIAGVDADRYDIVINNVSPTEERKQKYDFSNPYVASEGKVAVLQDSELQTIEDLNGGATAASSETSNFRTLLEEAGAQMTIVTGFDEAIEQVLTGRVDACGNDAVTFAYYTEQHPDAPIRLLDGVLGDASESAILMPKGATTLQTAINDSIAKHLENGDFKAIYEKYVGIDLSPQA
ncbi:MULTISPECIES: transporter substrate-binding domain-containing protein [Rothia]|uniref:Amino acid ABC transporter substrate-binding protein n=1 Tax=Rothia nasimurium TaxID=85336 RepID=A0A1Y1RN88_9MICC|nr:MULTISPECIES: transporter substrate-binding domain-containing protein [Rothia]ORC16071.1 amino acid ABC transporter substrate-binding protein [Rothia nasimurium]